MTYYQLTRGESAALAAIGAERGRQVEKWGDQPGRSPVEWIAIATEELGETAKEANDLHFAPPPRGSNQEIVYALDIAEATAARMRTELVQLAAVCLAWAGHLYTETR